MSKDQLKFWSLVGVRTGVALAAIGWLMLILHLNGSRLVFILGGILCILAYTFRTAWKQHKNATDWAKLILVVCIFTRGIVGVNHWPFPNWLWISCGVIILASLLYIFFKDPNSLIPSSSRFIVSKVFFSAAACLIVIGAMFKIMHWPWAGILLSAGTLSLVLWLVLEPFLPSKNKAFNTTNTVTTLDESLTEDAADNITSKNRNKHKPIYFLAGAMMLLGLFMNLLSLPGAGYIILGGFIFGGIYLFSTLR